MLATVIFPVFLQQNTLFILLKVLTKTYITRDNGLPYFLPTKQCFGNALPKAIETYFKVILLIITYTAEGVRDSSRRKLSIDQT